MAGKTKVSQQASDAAAVFFDALGERGHEPALEYVTGSVAFELANGRGRRRWRVDVRKGDVAVSRAAGPADCTFRAGEDVFRKIITGRSSPMTAVLRGEVAVEGDPRMLLLFRRLLPTPGRRRR